MRPALAPPLEGTHSPWMRWLIVVMGMGALLASVGVAQERRRPLPDGTILVTVTGLKSDDGRVPCALFRGSRGFPTEPERIYKGALGTPRDGTARCRFEDVPQGVYAVAVLHDEDADGEMDRGLFGIPSEGYGASNDARGTMGPPSWEDARFAFGGASLRMRVRIEY